MPLLPTPAETTITGGDLPVTGASDVLAEFPRPHRNPTSAPVRDALCEGFASGHLEYQCQAERAAAQCDPLRATGDYLREKADERGIIPAPGESEAAIRARLFTAPDIVVPDAIEAAVNEVIAPKTCRISELELDGWFIHGATAVWDSYVGAPPDYPDRYYAELPQTQLPSAVPSNGLPRSFHVRVPVLATYNSNFAFVTTASSADGFFTGETGFIFVDQKTATDAYEAIIGRVQAIKGQGISWSLVEDANL